MSIRAVAAVEASVRAALERLKLPHDSRILLGISGGADSVALLNALTRVRRNWRLGLTAAHFNHRLRGAESDRDEDFVRDLCTRMGFELIVERAESPVRTSNLEERSRQLRHEFLNRAANQVDANWIALAHTRDDQVETVLMRLMRGAGVSGLGAMAERGPGRLFRPLLGINRATIERYLHAIGAEYMDDSSNKDLRFLRNRVRHQLLPLMESDFSPGLRRRLAEVADEMRELDQYMTVRARAEVAKRMFNGRFDHSHLSGLPAALAQRVIREFLRQQLGDLRHISRKHVQSIIALVSGMDPAATTTLPGRWVCRREYEHVMVEPLRARTLGNRFAVNLVLPGRTDIPACGFSFEAQILDMDARPDKTEPLPKSAAMLDAGAAGCLSVRNFCPGDRIAPLGLHGTRKVHDVFIDRKLPRNERSRWPLVAAYDEIVWIPGIVRSNCALITSKTKKILYLEAIPMSRSESRVVA